MNSRGLIDYPTVKICIICLILESENAKPFECKQKKKILLRIKTSYYYMG